MPSFSEALSTEMFLTVVASGLALLAVWMPFWRGLRVVWHTRMATRRVDAEALRIAYGGGDVAARGSFAVSLARVFGQSVRENDARHPTGFLADASRQYVLNEYDATYANPLSMYANLLPPIGFIGTTVGLMVLFASVHLADRSLEVGALAVALTSTIFALVGYASLEALKIRLYARLLDCIDAGLSAAQSPVPVPTASDATAAEIATP